MKNLNDTIVFTAVVSPLTSDGELDLRAFEGLLRRQEGAGNGVVVIGSTGEGLALSLEQKKILVSAATRLKLQVPVVAGVGGFQLEECQSWIEWCESQGVNGFLLVTPIYAKPGAEGQRAWFTALLDKATRPCMIYNVPSRAGVKLHPAALRAISAHRSFWAVKESSGSVADFLGYQAVAPRARFFCGDDGMMPYFASAGAVGLVSVASNVWPEAVNAYTALCLRGEHKGLLPLWHRASEALFSASNPVPVKALLAKKGWIASARLLPPLSAGDMLQMENLLEADEHVAAWLAEQGGTR
jgi:4-hydroxy-tetrahydrodipicolinate synthase